MTKRLGALLVALLVLSLGASAFAANVEDEGHGTSGTAITSVAIPKDIVLFNTTTQNIYEPNITYTFTLETQDPSTAHITDKEEMTAPVRTGVTGLVTIQGANKAGAAGTASTSSASLVYGDDTFTALSQTNAEGTDVTPDVKVATRNLTLAFNVAALQVSGEYPSTAAGIYRYKITDTTAAADLTAAGIARSENYDPVRYLDVYVEWNADHTVPQVYGWVLYKTSDGTLTANGTTSLEYDDSVTTYIKVNGYNVASEMKSADGTTVPTSDEYHTYNLSVTKTTTGALADLNQEFPVAVSFANATVTSLTDFYSTGDYEQNALALNASGAYTVNTDYSGVPSVKNGDTFSFIGLPVGTTFQVGEKNASPDSYKVKIEDKTTGTAATLFAEAIVDAGENTGLTTATAMDNVVTADSWATQDIAITNTLDTISPTGYVSRFAPFAVILVGGILLLVLSRRKSKEDEA